ncbi:MAG: bis(5'-nucleosyl)-tetraphosphatase (symmetrical) YqeK [Firmicutes bacterium]|nr:bis(5'-nucleosyl)-tetraphosphatase (symmetrical) YqeK [Bacillota bacterium]
MENETKINEIKNTLQQTLDVTRYAHTIAVCETAVTLAKRFGADVEKAYLAALLHDCARGLSKAELLEYCKQNNIPLDGHMQKDINPVHALVSADIAKRQFGINDKEILDAIHHHAIGAENMTLLDKIIFVADATEPNRTEPDEINNDLYKARHAAESDLDKAIAPVMRLKTRYLYGKPMHPTSTAVLQKYE